MFATILRNLLVWLKGGALLRQVMRVVLRRVAPDLAPRKRRRRRSSAARFRAGLRRMLSPPRRRRRRRTASRSRR